MNVLPRRARGVLAVALCSLVLSACGGSDGTDGTRGGYISGDGSYVVVDAPDRKDAPELEGEDLEGEPLSLEQFAGKVVVVNVWGSWCPPCRAEEPILSAVARELADDDVQFVGIATRDVAGARAFERAREVPYPSFADDAGTYAVQFADSLPTMATPTTWIIDADGKVAVRYLGPFTSESTLRGLIEDVQGSRS
ncbi:TlpA disulfide reductase family protein [Aeromicrobium sp. IC_218]|uniref:TlpA family protein disulfide reductase n=1 Tax=Aeromicrobium sp. IC_218 TaxID=2545468 RepID=UPI00103C4934|nr:TlpA disulfide reductase family protein [Aeromicrobium sp. IC_218]TCJ00836.1 TlpA family protein disulfide reductase [Aeromicrobium sp. IC_218]